MKISKLDITGAHYIEATRYADERGWFQEWFKKSDLQKHLDFDFTPVQANISYSAQGVIRGIHYSIAPQGQAKLVTVMHGAIDDYVIDINPKSSDFGKWEKRRLEAQDGNALLLSPHVGHAFQALTDNTVVCYLVTAEYDPDSEHAINPMCPKIKIEWDKRFATVISSKDLASQTLVEQMNLGLLPK